MRKYYFWNSKLTTMKNLFILIMALAIVSCKEEAPKDYVTLSGKITDKNSDSLMVRTRTYSKTIKVNEDGTFSDTLKVEPGIYTLFDGSEATSIFLKNGYDINMTIDTKEFDESVTFSGDGAEHSSFLAKKSLLEEKLLDLDKLGKLNSIEELDTEFEKIKSELSTFYASTPELDSIVKANANNNLEPMLKSYKNYIAGSIALKTELPKGSPSPTFENYENYAGGTTSLSDLKGKYVYVDVWATWCGPCKVEIPYLKEVEEKYKGKNIEFVSISVDDGRGYRADTKEAAKALSVEGWKEMIAEKEMGGIQLLADNAWQSDFVQGYKIRGIPRFILIDPDGNIVTPDAPRPSSESLIELFNELNI